MAEPGVIDRMAAEYAATWQKASQRVLRETAAANSSAHIQVTPEQVTAIGQEAMLAAVRELRDCMAEDANLTVNWRDVINSYLLDVMTEHGKVSKSDKPPSHTNPPSG